VPAVPLNPETGGQELGHVVGDSAPSAVLCAPEAELPPALASLERVDVRLAGEAKPESHEEPAPESAALVVYTSGTTGPPKGVVIPRRAIASNLDALAQAWRWTPGDVLVHGLPLFHVHGLVLGLLGPARLGCRVVHVGRFSPEAVADELERGATMLFGVPTMYRRLADAGEQDAAIAAALGRARLLVSGSAGLPAREHARVEALCGQRIVERYGMTETLMNCAVRADGDRRPGSVGPPLPGVELRLVADDGAPVEEADAMGEIEVRGPNLFSGYLNRPDATAEVMRDGWFRTGDLATRDPDGYVRIVGRRSTDLIKTGGYRVGAGEVEGALLEHPAVAEAAVLGEPDDDLGERIVAWVVPSAGSAPGADELLAHVGRLLASHKRPRDVHFVEALPRNELGKVVKSALRGRLPGGDPPEL
jgi:malonyl-CoA/methylmalonyl-CoA synthetase